MITEYQRGLLHAAEIADFYAVESLRLAGDYQPSENEMIAFDRMVTCVGHCGAARGSSYIADAVRKAAV